MIEVLQKPLRKGEQTRASILDVALDLASREGPRLQSLFSRWIARVSLEIASGCIYISGAVEYDDRPGPIREHLVKMVRTWQLALQRAAQQAVDEHHLAPDTDTQQLVFEMYGLVLALHHDARFIRSPGCVDRAHAGFARLIAMTRVS
ncbi:MAG: hypothetical protein LW731_04600 [Oxalobacteraceae bacterium]|nr:hypothetical protein [Oxalobacteraceae bacterium]